MDALILAAGLGTRLGAVGRDTPKALIAIGGRTMLERAVAAVVEAGATRVVVNVHHHAEAIERFVRGRAWGVELLLSREEERPLETGGALVHARALLREDDLLLVHNVDVAIEGGLAPLVEAQRARAPLATLAVSARETARYLLFDDAGLVGREDRRSGARQLARAARGAVRALAFGGVHACAPRLPGLLTERGVFPIVDAYLRLAAAGEALLPWVLPAGRWIEIGTPERLAAARARWEAAG